MAQIVVQKDKSYATGGVPAPDSPNCSYNKFCSEDCEGRFFLNEVRYCESISHWLHIFSTVYVASD